MQKYIPILTKTPLFQGLNPEELERLLTCLHARIRRADESSFLLHAGETTDTFGIILKGSVHVIEEDFLGNSTLLAHITSGELFAEAFALSGMVLHVSVKTAEPSEILWLSCRAILSGCANDELRQRWVTRLLSILAKKNVFLAGRLHHLSGRSLREKVMSYLSEQAATAQNAAFDIPLNRQELANYLAVDRSALSAVLGKLQDEGLICFHKNHFELL